MPLLIQQGPDTLILESENELPQIEDYCNAGFKDATAKQYHEDVANWISSAKRIVVHPEEVEKFHDYILNKVPFGKYQHLGLIPALEKEGIEIPSSIYEVRDIPVLVDYRDVNYNLATKETGYPNYDSAEFAYFKPEDSREKDSRATKTAAGDKLRQHLRNYKFALGMLSVYSVTPKVIDQLVEGIYLIESLVNEMSQPSPQENNEKSDNKESTEKSDERLAIEFEKLKPILEKIFEDGYRLGDYVDFEQYYQDNYKEIYKEFLSRK